MQDFGGSRALDKANLEIYPGTIHSLVGQNGAGKSTLIKILAGIYRQDSGTIKIRGESHPQLTPRIAEHLGIHFIHQDRLLVPAFTVIGTTLHRENRPTIVGTIFGVLLLSFVANGWLLVGWNFYWQQVGTGVLIFFVLAVSFLGRKVRGYF